MFSGKDTDVRPETAASHRRILWAVAAALAGMVFASAASAAQANVYCVDVTGGDCTHFPAGVQAALSDADANPGADTVRLGANTYAAPLQTGFTYAGTNGPVSIVGSGEGQTTIAVPAAAMAPGSFTLYHGLVISGLAAAGSSISDLSLTLPVPPDTGTNQLYRGFFTEAPNVSISRVSVTDAGMGAAEYAVVMGLGGQLSDSTISLSSSSSGATGVSRGGNTNSAFDLVVERSLIEANRPITYSNETFPAKLVVRRSTLRPGDNSYGVGVAGGGASISSTLIDLGTATSTIGIGAENLNNNDDAIDVDADHVTIVGGGAGTIGVRAQGSSTIDGEDATVDLTNSVISGPAKSIVVRADNDDVAAVTTSFSNYIPVPGADVDNDIDNAGATGTATLTETNQTTHAPGFVNPAMGDYHLAAGSPLIDAGDPMAPVPGSVDLDGDPRALSTASVCNGPAAGRRDIGADEFAVAPGVCPANPPQPAKKKCKKRKNKKKKCKRKKG